MNYQYTYKQDTFLQSVMEGKNDNYMASKIFTIAIFLLAVFGCKEKKTVAPTADDIMVHVNSRRIIDTVYVEAPTYDYFISYLYMDNSGHYCYGNIGMTNRETLPSEDSIRTCIYRMLRCTDKKVKSKRRVTIMGVFKMNSQEKDSLFNHSSVIQPCE